MRIKEMVLTDELLEKAKVCGSAEEIRTLAKENGRELTEEQAENYFEKLAGTNGALSDDELDSVSGGVCEERTQECTCGGTMYEDVIQDEGKVWLCSSCGRSIRR